MTSKKLRLITKDHEIVEADYADLQISVLCSTVAESTENDLIEFDLPNVDKKSLDKILEYGRHFKEAPMQPIPKPLPLVPFHEIVDPWYASFITQFEVIEGLYPLIKAVNYMDIPPLQELACARIASLIRGKEPGEIKKILGIEEDGKETEIYI